MRDVVINATYYQISSFYTECLKQFHCTGPEVVKTVTNETVTKEDLGGASVHAGGKSGVAHGSYPNDVAALRAMRTLLDYLPSSNDESTLPERPVTDDPQRLVPSLDQLVPDDPNQPYDMKDIIREVLDNETMFEIQPEYAKNILTAFGRMEGRTVGIVGNNPMTLAGCLDISASEKAARFVRFCDAFNIPILTVSSFCILQQHCVIIQSCSSILFSLVCGCPRLPSRNRPRTWRHHSSWCQITFCLRSSNCTKNYSHFKESIWRCL
jgi:acetyl-CoA carboxylase carboxyltransferase component